MNLSMKQKQNHRHGEQTSGCQWGWGKGQFRGGELRHKLLGIRQAQGCIAQHREYSHYFVITVNGKEPLKLYKNKKVVKK